MNARFIIVLAAVVMAVTAPAFAGTGVALVSAAETALRSHAPPAEFLSADPAGGGRLLYGRIGGAMSETSAFHAGLRRADRYFGSSLHVNGALRSTPRGGPPAMLGLFRATLDGVSVSGLAVSSIDPKGGARLMLAFDRDDRVNSTLPSLLAEAKALAIGRASVADVPQGGNPPVLHVVKAQDRTASVGVPADWKLNRLGEGVFAAGAPDGAAVYVTNTSVLSPGGYPLPGLVRMPFIPDPAQAYAAVIREKARMEGAPDPQIHITASQALVAGTARLTGTVVVKSVLRRFDAIVGVRPASQAGGVWSVGGKFMSAPADRFAADEMTMLAVANSYHLDSEAYNVQVQTNIENIKFRSDRNLAMSRQALVRQNALFQRTMGEARAAQDSIDRSTAGFIGYINDSAVVKDETTGGHHSFTAASAQALVEHDPRQYSIVPMNQYRKGVDY